MHDPLLEEDPWGLSLQEKSYAESFAYGQLLMGRKLLLILVQIKFPRLTRLARARMMHMDQWEAVHALFLRLLEAEDDEPLALDLLLTAR